MIAPTRTCRLTLLQVPPLMGRICKQLGIAYSENRVMPGLSDLEQEMHGKTDCEVLNATGRAFGLRFREMTGSMNDLISLVVDLGPVLIWPQASDLGPGEPILILEVDRRGQLLTYEQGQERRISIRQLRRRLPRNRDRNFSWLAAQSMLAAEDASRYHYQQGTQGSPLTPLRRFIGLLKPEWEDIRSILVFSMIIGLLSLTTPLAVEAVVNTIAFGRYLQPLVVLSLMVLTFLGFRAGLNVLMTVVVEIIQRKLFVRTVEDLSYRLTRVPMTIWKKYHGPELVNRFFDVFNVQKITSKLLLDSLMLFLQTLIGLSVLAFYHPFLLGYDIGLLCMMTVVLWMIGRGAIRTAQEESHLKYETAAWLQEMVRHPSTFRYNGGLKFAINRADELAAQYINQRQSHFKILIRQITFSMVMQVVAATVLLALGGYLVIEGQMTLGQLVAAELIVTVILGSFAKLGKDLESFYDLMASVDKLGKLYDLPIESTSSLQMAWHSGAYPLSLVGLPQTDSSDGSLRFDAGRAYAIVGCNEHARGRLVEGMTGQAKLDTGYVLLDDYRVDSISNESLQEKISVVRDIEIFEGTIDDNIRMGRAHVGSREINRVVQQLGLRDVIATLPEGFAERISISGYPLEPGQAIRLILARALVARPAVLVIDSLLDRLSDRDLEEVLSQLQPFLETTTIIASTGRRAVAQWAEQCLDVDQSRWELAEFSD